MFVRQLIIMYIILTAGITCGYSQLHWTCRNAVLEELKKYPALEIQDIYKLVYQAAMGNEHMMVDTAMVKKYLDEELHSIEASSTEPLLEYLTTDSTIARLNLRPFKALKGNPILLFNLMKATSVSIKPSKEILRLLWQDIEILSDEQKIPFRNETLHQYFKEMENRNFPPVHHSKTVRETYRPAYRIISGKSITIDQLR